MKVKNVILKVFLIMCCFLSGSNITQANPFDEIEEQILSGPETAHFAREVISSELVIAEDHQTTKIKCRGGDIMKITYDDSWVVESTDFSRLEKAAYVVTTASVKRIMEHWFVENDHRIARIYLQLPNDASPTSVMHYRFLDKDFQVTCEVLERMLSLAFSTYNRYLKVTVPNLVLVADPEHLALAEHFIRSQEGLRAQSK